MSTYDENLSRHKLLIRVTAVRADNSECVAWDVYAATMEDAERRVQLARDSGRYRELSVAYTPEVRR